MDLTKKEPSVAMGLLFFLIYALACALPVPGTRLLATGAGVFFAGPVAFFLVLGGACTGASLGFCTVRHLARQWFSETLQRRFPALYGKIEDNSLALLVALRLSPLVPFSVVHGFMAITKIKFSVFLAVTFLGSVLYTTLWVFSGWILKEVLRDPEHGLQERWDVLLGLVVLSAVPILLKWWSGSKRSSSYQGN